MCSEKNAQDTGAWDKNLSNSTLLGTSPLQVLLLNTGAGTLREPFLSLAPLDGRVSTVG